MKSAVEFSPHSLEADLDHWDVVTNKEMLLSR